jgi:hypothetical protein
MQLRVLYVGQPGTARTEAFLEFLRAHIAAVREANIADLGSLDVTGIDVVVVDGTMLTEPNPPARLALSDLPLPTVLVGVVGGAVGDALGLKLGWRFGCACLDHRMLAATAPHPILEGPVPVPDAAATTIPAPDSFLQYSLIKDVPETVSVLDVAYPEMTPEEHEAALTAMRTAALSGDIEEYHRLRALIPDPGLVTTSAGFFDSPDCEAILGGINSKAHDYVAVGRQGRFLQWGFEASPDRLTPLGQALLLNSIAYIHEVGPQPVLALRAQHPRDMALASLTVAEPDDPAGSAQLARHFGEHVPADLVGTAADGLDWFTAHRGYLRRVGLGNDGVLELDTDLVDLGLANDDPALLDRLASDLDAPGPDGARARRLWTRYVRRATADVAGERAWLAEHRAELFFSDWADFRWIAPRDLPELVAPRGGFARGDNVNASFDGVRGPDGVITATLTVRVADDYYVYSPDASDGLPTVIAVTTPGMALAGPPVFPPTPDGHLRGESDILLALTGPARDVELDVTVQACNSVECLPPTTMHLVATIAASEQAWTAQLGSQDA